MMKYALVAILVGALMMTASPGIAQEATQAYTGPTGDQYVFCDVNDVVGYCIGGAIFNGLPAGQITITLEDNHLAEVGGAYGWGAGSTDFCGSTVVPNFPGDFLQVWVDGPVFGSGLGVLGTTCPDIQVGVEGLVRVNW